MKTFHSPYFCLRTMPFTSAFLGLGGLLLLALATEAQHCPKGRRTYLYKPKPTPRTTDFLETCQDQQRAYDCIKPTAETYDPQADFVDFDAFVKKYVECIYGNQYLSGLNMSYINPTLPGFYVAMSMKNMVYGEEKRLTNSLPEVLLVKKLHNTQVGEYIKSEVMQSVERTQTTSTTIEKGFSTSASVEAGIKTPFVEASVKAEVNYNLDNSQTQTETHTKTLSLTDTIVVPPNSTVKLVWSISQSEMNVPWTGELQISGWIPVKPSWESDYSFIPVGHMAAFFEEFFEFETSTSMVYHTAGNFRGVNAVDSHIDTIEMPLQADQRCPKKRNMPAHLVDYLS